MLTYLVLGLLAVDGGVAPVPPAADGGTAAAAKVDVKALVDRVQRFYEQTQDFTATFRQDYTYQAFKRTQTSTGKVTFKKPAMMRWDYDQPAGKAFVLANDRVYAFDPEAKLLTRAALGTNKLSASVTFLMGQGKLGDEFTITQGVCVSCQGVLLELTPKVADPRFKRVLLEVDPASAAVLKSTVIDPDGSQNAITFLGLKTNVGVDAAVFKLSPPPGTQVQDFLSPSAPAADAGR